MSSVTLGMTTKGINSTSRQMSAGVTMDCKLKDPVCGLHSPVFKVKGLSKSYNNYNYCTWRGRYYWVDEILFLTNDIQEVHCHLDPLATFKGAIDDTYAYVQYGDAGHWNKFIDDIRISPELEAPEWCDTQMFEVCSDFSSEGVVIVRYMDCGPNSGVKTVSMTPSAFFNMLDDLGTLFNGKTIDEIAAYVGGCGSWRDNILSCRWIPIDLPTTGESGIVLGAIQCTVPCHNIPAVQEIKVYDVGIDIDWSVFNDHPFAKTSRWTTCQIITPFGYSTIPIDYLRNQSKIYYRLSINATTGQTAIKVSERTNGDGYCYASFSGDLGVDLMGMLGTGLTFRESVKNAFGFGADVATAAISAGLSMGGAMFTQEMVDSGQLGGGSSSIAAHNMANANVRQTTMSSGISALQGLSTGVNHTGFCGSISGGSETLWLTSPEGNCLFIRKSFRPLMSSGYDDFCDMYGYPVNRYLQLSSVTGYCKCSGAFVRDIPGANPADISTINSFLNNGIVLEA